MDDTPPKSGELSLMYCGSWLQILGPYRENDRSAKETQWVQGSTKFGKQEADDRKSSLFGAQTQHTQLLGKILTIEYKSLKKTFKKPSTKDVPTHCGSHLCMYSESIYLSALGSFLF